MSSTPTILLPELAALLGRPGEQGERYIMRKHRALSEEHGFPRRLPTGWAWPRALVNIWIETAGGPSQAPATAADDPAHGSGATQARGSPGEDGRPNGAEIIAAQRRFLTRRYVGGQK